MAKRIYVGKLPLDARGDDVRRFFEDETGVRVADARVMTGYGFLAFDTLEEAEQVLRLDGREFQGQPLIVQFAKENKPRREPPRDMRPSNRRPGFPVIVSNVSRDVSWQDLKDFGREAGGGVTFSDIDRDVPGQGILEYFTQEEADHAVRELDGRELRGQVVGLRHGDSRSSGRRYDDHRAPPRRHYSRSRSPPRRYDDRYDDRRGYDDRRYEDRRYEDRRYEGRGYEDRRGYEEDRYERDRRGYDDRYSGRY